MIEFFALGLYGVQWLGVALGVGAQTVIMIAHLLFLHERKHPWLSHVPGARQAQAFGLFLMISSGVGAIAVHLFTASQATLWQPAFGFKWMLIILLWAAYRLERPEGHGQAALEGFAGATWFALFLVHTLAPVTSWPSLFLLYVLWLVAFGAVWGSFVALMAFAGRPKVVKEIREVRETKPEEENVMIYHNTPTPPAPPEVAKPAAVPPPAPKLAPAPQPPILPKPVEPAAKPAPRPPKPEPKPMMQPMPVAAAVAHTTPPVIHAEPATPRISLWQRIKNLFGKKEHPAQKETAKPAVSAPAPHAQPKALSSVQPIVPKQPLPVAGQIPSAPVWPLQRDIPPPPMPQSHVPAVAHLEIEAPHAAAPMTKATVTPAPEKKEPEVDYRDLPALQIMPQKPEEVATRNRGPIVSLEQTAGSGNKTIDDALRNL